jgi:hypothetical protein
MRATASGAEEAHDLVRGERRAVLGDEGASSFQVRRPACFEVHLRDVGLAQSVHEESELLHDP